jgi:ADP-ribose pyrophosphatase YjhB (NUDIX family)
MLTQGVAIVVISPDRKKVYLSERLDCGLYACPGGCVELDESIFQAAIRELKEEVGLKRVNDVHNPELIYYSTTFHLGRKTDCTVWMVTLLKEGEKLLNLEPTKHGEWKAYDPFSQIPFMPLFIQTKEIITDVFKFQT